MIIIKVSRKPKEKYFPSQNTEKNKKCRTKNKTKILHV